MEYEVRHEKGKCLECGDVIEYGRQDKKYCCETCKNKFNNRHRNGSRAIRMKILSTLNKNYMILENLLKIRITSLSVAELQNIGFKFSYFTSYQKVRRHDVYMCFDISFTVIADRVTSICKNSINLPSLSLGTSKSVSVGTDPSG